MNRPVACLVALAVAACSASRRDTAAVSRRVAAGDISVAGDRWVKKRYTLDGAGALAGEWGSWATRHIPASASRRVAEGSSVVENSRASGMSVDPDCMNGTSRWRDPVGSVGRVRTVAGCSRGYLLTAAGSSRQHAWLSNVPLSLV